MTQGPNHNTRKSAGAVASGPANSGVQPQPSCGGLGAERRAVPVWHRVCRACNEPFEQPRKRGRALESCGKQLCVAILRYVGKYGRWPPHVWFARYAVEAGLIKLPKKLARIAAGPQQQRLLP